MTVQLLPHDDPMLRQDHRKHRCPPKLRKQVAEELQQIYRYPPYGSCAGMAAPQIGYPYNMFVAQGELFENVKHIQLAGEPYGTIEGCFSCPNQHRVTRYPEVIVTFKEGVPGATKWYSGYMAQVIQHEYDHIKGILISEKKGD